MFMWMAVIFRFSAVPASGSTEMSQSVGRKICTIFVPGFAEMDEEAQKELAERIDFPIRKAAHATEYAVLGILAAMTFGAFGYAGAKRWTGSWILSVLYAVSDEFHQLFVPGRSGQLRDVCIDSIGAAFGILLMYFLLRLLKWYRQTTKAH